MLGKHLLKSWSSTQASVALSSGEAEFYRVVRCAGVGLGVKALFSDLGLAMPFCVCTDSSAAIGIAGRQGLGKLRHIECSALWIQQRLRRGEFTLRKVLGTAKPADVFIKFFSIPRSTLTTSWASSIASTAMAGQLLRQSYAGSRHLRTRTCILPRSSVFRISSPRTSSRRSTPG